MFEIKKSDLGARIGIIHTRNHGKIETPAYVPVVHPIRQTIPASKMKQMGFDLVITNAYITMKNSAARQQAEQYGIHSIVGGGIDQSGSNNSPQNHYDGAVMTDSGGFQVLEYGEVEVTPPDMAKFEQKIRTDFAIPLDRPTGFNLPKKTAESHVRHTLKVCKETLAQVHPENKKSSNLAKDKTKTSSSSELAEQIWVGPIQGGEYSDLVKRSARELVKYGFQMLALGSPVEFMESYEYKLLAQMIIAAKKSIPHSVPLHLFGAGHPLTIPLAVSLGCDTFDSASYMLYAKRGKYIAEDRTLRLDKMQYFSCNCEVCTNYTPQELFCLDDKEHATRELALHNLYQIKSEVDRVKEAIVEGRLWEYTIKKMRSHPRLYNAMNAFLLHSEENFVKTTPRFKERGILLFSLQDQHRPEVVLFHKMVRQFKTKRKRFVILTEPQRKPLFLSSEYFHLQSMIGENENTPQKERFQVCYFNPILGIVPAEISDIYPASHYEWSDRIVSPSSIILNEENGLQNDDHHSKFAKSVFPQLFVQFKKTWEEFFSNNDFEDVFVVKSSMLKNTPSGKNKAKNDTSYGSSNNETEKLQLQFLEYFLKLLPKHVRVRKSLRHL